MSEQEAVDVYRDKDMLSRADESKSRLQPNRKPPLKPEGPTVEAGVVLDDEDVVPWPSASPPSLGYECWGRYWFRLYRWGSAGLGRTAGDPATLPVGGSRPLGRGRSVSPYSGKGGGGSSSLSGKSSGGGGKSLSMSKPPG